VFNYSYAIVCTYESAHGMCHEEGCIRMRTNILHEFLGHNFVLGLRTVKPKKHF